MVATAVTLSCEQCRRRKTKCDKRSPCSACQQSGITCTAIQRPRRPRGRHARAKHNEDVINSRILQLEDLVRSFEVCCYYLYAEAAAHHIAEPSRGRSSPVRGSRFLATDTCESKCTVRQRLFLRTFPTSRLARAY